MTLAQAQRLLTKILDDETGDDNFATDVWTLYEWTRAHPQEALDLSELNPEQSRTLLRSAIIGITAGW